MLRRTKSGKPILPTVQEACAFVDAVLPDTTPRPGRWTPCNVTGAAGKIHKHAGRILLRYDGSGVVWNHVTGEYAAFDSQIYGKNLPDPVVLNRMAKRNQDEQRERREAAAEIAKMLIRRAIPRQHPYFAAKGFPMHKALVIDEFDVWDMKSGVVPGGLSCPVVVVPALVDGRISSAQLIDTSGVKKNLTGGAMTGACHYLERHDDATFTAIAEGIATALTIRSAISVLGYRANVMCAFSAANVSLVASREPGRCLVFADNDKIQERLGNAGAGEFYARASGKPWIMPDELGDWNDVHTRHGIAFVADSIAHFLKENLTSFQEN